MRISIDTDSDSYENALATVKSAFGVTDEAEWEYEEVDEENESPAATPDDFYPGNYTRKRLKKFAEFLAEDAAEAVRYIASHAPTVSIDDTISYMGQHLGIAGFGGQHMGGRMASVGFAVNSLSGVKEAPYSTDYKNRLYRMDERTAKVLLEYLGQPSA